MNNDFKKIKKYFEKKYFNLMNNAVFRKTMEIVRKHREKKKLLDVRTTLLYYKVFHRKFISKRNEKRKRIY